MTGQAHGVTMQGRGLSPMTTERHGKAALGVVAGLALGIQAAAPALAVPAEVLLLRHGHKDIQRHDSNLSPQGLARMLDLARALPACFGPPTRIIVYPFDRPSGRNARSYQSAVPLAVARGLRIEIAETAPEQSEPLGRSLLEDPAANGDRVVMIWEHRHLPDLARGLGWPTMPAIADQDFDRLERLIYTDGSPTPAVQSISQLELLTRSCAGTDIEPHQGNPIQGPGAR